MRPDAAHPRDLGTPLDGPDRPPRLDAPLDPMGRTEVVDACETCLARAWLLRALAPRLERVRSRIDEILGRRDDELARAVGLPGVTAVRDAGGRFDPERLRAEVAGAGLSMVCRCSPGYPGRLHELTAPPAVLFVAGDGLRTLAALDADVVAVVGTRRPTDYGRSLATELSGGLVRAGITVTSGMAFGIDGAAHRGALAGGEGEAVDSGAPAGGSADVPTVAVLPTSPERAHPAGHQQLHRRILARGGAISELPPGTAVGRWSFPARNRIIAALAAMTVVVEARERSGALLTAAGARALGRPVGAAPGRVGAETAEGTHALLREGAVLVRGAADVVEALFGRDERRLAAVARPPLAPPLRAVLDGLLRGEDPAGAIAAAGMTASAGLAALAELELAGRLRRGPAGRVVVR